jgi:phytoene dehydrogenase-like protein
MAKKVLVIGAGIAGLSSASYLQRNGFDTEIFEMHDKPGGLCSAWRRRGFTFDGCIHWLMGSGRSSNMHHIWEELGAGDLDYLEWDTYMVAALPDGDAFTIYTDPDRLEAELLRLGPEDAGFARLVASKVRAVARADLPPAYDKLGFGEAMRLLAAMPAALPVLTKWTRIPLQRLVDELKSERLRGAFRAMFGDAMRDFPAGGLFMMLGYMAKKSAGYPLGGSLAFARAIESKYLSLGGKIRYGAKVDRIVVEGGRAVGLEGAWGWARGDYIVSAGDGRDLLDRLLGGRAAGGELDSAFKGLKRYPSLLYLGLGLDKDCAGLPHMQVFELEKPLVLEGGALELGRLSLRLFNFDPSLAPAGKTSATVMIETYNDEYWTGLAARDPAAYSAEKGRVVDAVIAAIDSRLPGFASWVEVADLATPRTFIRYTNNWRGSYEGWLPTSSSFMRSLPRSIPGIAGLHLVGQWLSPGGGLPPAGMDGRNLARKLCRAEGRRFLPDGAKAARPAGA